MGISLCFEAVLVREKGLQYIRAMFSTMRTHVVVRCRSKVEAARALEVLAKFGYGTERDKRERNGALETHHNDSNRCCYS